MLIIGKNDFWSVRWGSPINVGRVELVVPELQGAVWHAEQDMALAEVRTVFAKPDRAGLGARSWVDANRNLLLTELVNSGQLSDWPLQEKDGKTIFRYSEKGPAWFGDNTLGIHHIYPAGAIGLDSDPRLLRICHNMIEAMNRWEDGNGTSSWYAACARIGYDPEIILARLHQCIERHAMPNGLMAFGGGGIENYTAPLMVCELLLQSHEGVIRLFPCWPRNRDARFGNLRTVGAFLVSAELKNGVVEWSGEYPGVRTD